MRAVKPVGFFLLAHGIVALNYVYLTPGDQPVLSMLGGGVTALGSAMAGEWFS